MTTYYLLQIAQATGSETQSEIANGAAGTFLVSNGTSSAASYKVPTVASTVGTSASPSGTTSTTYVMLGLGGSWKITPTTYGNVRITINGQLNNGTTGDGINVIMAYGTGTAPTNGAALTGTTVGINTIFTDLTGLLTNGVPFSKDYIITGLTAGTAYWFDLQFKAVTGGTASVINCQFTAQELMS